MRVTLYESKNQPNFLIAFRTDAVLDLMSVEEKDFFGEMSRIHECDIRDPHLPEAIRTNAAKADLCVNGYFVFLVRQVKTWESDKVQQSGEVEFKAFSAFGLAVQNSRRSQRIFC
ncbi:hypothetical protein LIN78_15145 [Leeia sp. TBRC 13508]|uniref:Uncharacterized protein n=1 Tax=Leeia speluncae TaxID=2884804 RepID=A0ABS8D9I5_9NEIS|nr:hypothetical protein [Leeia speluncae]MCB6184883.1 hypothetical protein [Leeia speluncae]